ncbi:MAG: hypothetical protein P8H28_06635 [Porticoccaceae bacterium]|nr:hypothetical protein [Porticoccaceae bacterium]
MTVKNIILRPYLTKSILLASILLGGLSSCASTSTDDKKNYRVDRYSLIRSANYTQRELLALELSNTAVVNKQRHQLLVGSYCDLIARNAIYSADQSNACSNSDDTNSQPPVTGQCVANFHRCIKTCDLRSRDCSTCETAATTCLNSSQTRGIALSETL